MDFGSFSFQADAFEFGSRPESYRLFTYYHPQYQPDYPTYQDDQYASFVFDDPERTGEPAYRPSSVCGFRLGLGFVPLTIVTLIA